MARKRTRKEKRDMDLVWVRQLVEQAYSQRWFGTMELKFEDGNIRRGFSHQSLMPPSASPVEEDEG